MSSRTVPSGTDPSSLWPHLWRVVVACVNAAEAGRVAELVGKAPADGPLHVRLIEPDSTLRCALCDGLKAAGWLACEECNGRLQRAGLVLAADAAPGGQP